MSCFVFDFLNSDFLTASIGSDAAGGGGTEGAVSFSFVSSVRGTDRGTDESLATFFVSILTMLSMIACASSSPSSPSDKSDDSESSSFASCFRKFGFSQAVSGSNFGFSKQYLDRNDRSLLQTRPQRWKS